MSEKKADLSRVFDPPVKSSYEVIQKAYDKVSNSIYTDPLTGCFNNRYLEKFEQHFDPSRHQLNIVFIDLNDFGETNKKLGHFHGDQLLINSAAHFRQSFRKEDIVIRRGGDEFLILCPDDSHNPESDQELTKRIEIDILPNAPVKFAFGVSHYLQPDNGEVRFSLTINKADNLMREYKKQQKEQ